MRRTIFATTLLAAALLYVVGCWSRAGAEEATAKAAVAEPPRVIEVERGKRALMPPVITAVAIVPGGGLVATAGDDHVVRIWSTASGRIVHTLQGHGDWVRSLAFSPDGKVLASGGDDRHVILWQVANGKLLAHLPPHPHAVYSIAYNPEGSRLAAAGFEQTVRLYDPAAGALVRELDGPGVDLRSVVFSPDGRQMAAAGRNGQIRVWNMPSGTVQFDIAAGPGRIRTLAFVPNGQRLVSSGEGHAIAIWDASSGRAARPNRLPGGQGAVDGRLRRRACIATGGSDNVVRIWNWQTQAPRPIACWVTPARWPAWPTTRPALRLFPEVLTPRCASGSSAPTFPRRTPRRPPTRNPAFANTRRAPGSGRRQNSRLYREVVRGSGAKDFVARPALARQLSRRRPARVRRPAAPVPLRGNRTSQPHDRRPARWQRLFRAGLRRRRPAEPAAIYVSRGRRRNPVNANRDRRRQGRPRALRG